LETDMNRMRKQNNVKIFVVICEHCGQSPGY
jgi:hypothetical protein